MRQGINQKTKVMNQKKLQKEMKKASSKKKVTIEIAFCVDPKLKVSTAFINSKMVGYCPEGKEKEFSENIHDVIGRYRDMCTEILKKRG
jgi:hypothetical protein